MEGVAAKPGARSALPGGGSCITMPYLEGWRPSSRSKSSTSVAAPVNSSPSKSPSARQPELSVSSANSDQRRHGRASPATGPGVANSASSSANVRFGAIVRGTCKRGQKSVMMRSAKRTARSGAAGPCGLTEPPCDKTHGRKDRYRHERIKS